MFGGSRDLALEADPARRFLPWLLGIIVYLAALALAGMMGLGTAVERWDRGLKGTVTVQLPALKKGEKDPMPEVLATLRKTPGVVSAHALGIKETTALLEPWLGDGALARDLPLPRLIDVRIRTEAPPDMDGLAAVLSAGVPGLKIDDHRRSLARLVQLAHAVELVALIVVALVTLAAVATVVFITRTGLAIHHRAIELLHLIGASDAYVARQFQAQALDLGLRGGAIGLVLAAGTIAALGQLSGTLADGLLPGLDLTPVQWGALALVPVSVIAISMLTARMTVLSALRRLT